MRIWRQALAAALNGMTSRVRRSRFSFFLTAMGSIPAGIADPRLQGSFARLLEAHLWTSAKAHIAPTAVRHSYAEYTGSLVWPTNLQRQAWSSAEREEPAGRLFVHPPGASFDCNASHAPTSTIAGARQPIQQSARRRPNRGETAQDGRYRDGFDFAELAGHSEMTQCKVGAASGSAILLPF